MDFKDCPVQEMYSVLVRHLNSKSVLPSSISRIALTNSESKEEYIR